MPPSKSSDANHQTVRERQIAAAAHARSRKQSNNISNNHSSNGTSAYQNGSSLKEVALVQTENGQLAASGQGTGMSWNTAPLNLLNAYRVSHHLPTQPAFTTPLRQAVLTNPGIGRQSPTMARTKDKRRVSKDQLALAVRKNFNGAAVNEIDVITDLVYKVRHQRKAFRMRSTPSTVKKQ